MGWRVLAIVALILGALLGAFFFGVHTEGARRAAEVADLTRTHGEVLAAMDRAHRSALAEELQRRADLQVQHAQDMAALDERFTHEIETAKRRAAADLAAVRDGTVRLRDRFTCTPTPAGPSGTAADPGATTGVGDDAQAGGLRREDAAFLISESDRADEVTRQLQACQAIVRRDRAR